jgi:hypothetical protein
MWQIIMADSTMLLTAIANIQASLKCMIQNNQEKTDANLKEMKEELMARLEAKIKAKIKTNNDKFEVIQSTLCLPDGYPPSQNRGHSRSNSPDGKVMTACQEAMAACLETVKAKRVAT